MKQLEIAYDMCTHSISNKSVYRYMYVNDLIFDVRF